MKKEQILTKIEDKNDNVVNFEDEKAKLLAENPKTGMEPPDDYNWLAQLPEGAIFFTRHRHGKDSNALDLMKFLLIKKFANVTILRQEMPNRQVLEIPMHTKDFSATMKCIEIPIILELPPEVEYEEPANGQLQTEETPEETGGVES